MEPVKTIFSSKHFYSCQLKPNADWWQSLSSSLASWFTLVKKSLLTLFARVSQVTRAILLAKATNSRAYLGILVLALVPFTEVAYQLFKETINPDSYWDTYYFLYAIGPHMFVITSCTGIFLLFNESNKLRFGAILPATYKFAKIIWLATVTNNEQFHQIVPYSFVLIGLMVSVFWFISFDYLMSLHFHKKLGTIARMVGILLAKNVDEHKAFTIAKSEAAKYMQLK